MSASCTVKCMHTRENMDLWPAGSPAAVTGVLTQRKGRHHDWKNKKHQGYLGKIIEKITIGK